MSNLSDLLPAGAGGKQVSFTASGTISSGQTVALNSDGTVSAVASTGGALSAGTAVVFEAAALPTSNDTSIAFDSSNNKVVIVYTDTGNSFYGTAIVGTISGTTISFGSPVVFESAATYTTSSTFDSSNNKIVIAYRDAGLSNYGTVIAGTVSGTSITFGNATVFESAATYDISAVFDTNSNKVVITYRDNGNSDYGTAIVATYATPYFTLGSPVVFESAGSYSVKSVFDSSNNKVVVAYKDGGNSYYGTAIVGTVSGTSISFGTATVFENANSEPYIAFDTTENKVVIIYEVPSPNTFKGIVGTVSGTSISFGSATSIGLIDSSTGSVTYDSSVNKVVAFYNADASSYAGSAVVGTVSGTSISFDTPVSFTGAQTYNYASIFDSNANKVVVAYTDTGNSSYGTAAVVSTSTSTNTKFIGITDQAIADTATGSVTIKGGIAGTVAYNSGPGAITDWTTADYTTYLQTMTYDDNAGKLVIVYPSGTNSNYGYYVVGAVSGTSLSFGTPGLVSAVSLQWPDIVYDANAQKVVVAYNNGNDSDHGYAVVGTVSGTSVTWGTPVKFESGAVYYNSIVYDSSSQKVVISYMDSGNSNYGTSIVGTVSGTSISFGTAVVFESASTSWVSSIFDSTNNKIIIGYRDVGNSNYGTAIVGTVSGTSISFGSPAVFESSATDIISVAYDANANKIVVAYRDTVNSNAGTAVVGTVSGTNISFGTPVVFQASGMANQLNDITAQYDPSTQTVLIGFRDTGDSNYGKTVVGTVSGTSISFTTPATFNQNTTLGIITAYDANQQKMVIAFDQQGTTPDTKAFVYTPDTTLTPNTNYYVQSDGSLSTTASSVLAGKALSSTSINLDYTT